MIILRSFLALLSGFATMAIVVIVVTAILKKLVPEWVGADGRPKPAYVFVNLGYSFLAAAAGGYVTAWAALRNPLILVLALGIVVLLMSALSAMQSRGKQPIWYQLSLVAITPLGVLAGGLLRLRVLGIL
jgi:hypothetical protein